jgi:hypothetical protein
MNHSHDAEDEPECHDADSERLLLLICRRSFEKQKIRAEERRKAPAPISLSAHDFPNVAP